MVDYGVAFFVIRQASKKSGVTSGSTNCGHLNSRSVVLVLLENARESAVGTAWCAVKTHPILVYLVLLEPCVP